MPLSIMQSIRSGAAARGLPWPSRETFDNFARSPGASLPLPGGRRIELQTDRVRAAPAITPTLSMSLGMGAIGLGFWGLLFPDAVARFLGLPRNKPLIRGLFGARELATGYTLAGDPTRVDALWARVAGDVFDLMVLRVLVNPRNPKAGNARFAQNAVLLVTALDVLAALRMSNVQRNCR
jgi:hypothetical protein